MDQVDTDTICGLVLYCGQKSDGEIKMCENLIGKDVYSLSYYEEDVVALCVDGIYNLLDGNLLISQKNLYHLSNGKSNTHLALSTEHQVYSWGEAERGELGLGLCRKALSPAPIKKLQGNYVQLSSGNNHSMLCNTEGLVYGFGQNIDRQLALYMKSSVPNGSGKGDELIFAPRLSPFSLAHPIKMVACGYNFTVFLTKKEGHVYTCGSGDCGQLGVGTISRVDVLTKVNIKDDLVVDMIACGDSHVLCCDYSGEILYAWGLNSHGQIGLDPYTHKSSKTPIQVATKTNELFASDRVMKLFAEGNSSALLTQSGALFTWGCGKYRRLCQNDSFHISTPTKAAKFEDQAVSRFTFGPRGSAVCVASQIKSISPDCGPMCGFKRLTLPGNGLWDSGKVVVKIYLNEGEDDDCYYINAVVVDSKIVCIPPSFKKTGKYSVTASLDGTTYLPGVMTLYIHPALHVLSPSPAVVNRSLTQSIKYTLYLSKPDDHAEIPAELLSRELFVKIQLSSTPFTTKSAADMCRREVITVPGHLVNTVTDDSTSNDKLVIEAVLDLTAASDSYLLHGESLVYARPSISWNDQDYSRYTSDKTLWLIHSIQFENTTDLHFQLELSEDNEQYLLTRDITVNTQHMIAINELPSHLSLEAQFTASMSSSNVSSKNRITTVRVSVPLDTSNISEEGEEKGCCLSITPPRIIDFYHKFLDQNNKKKTTDETALSADVPTYLETSLNLIFVSDHSINDSATSESEYDQGSEVDEVDVEDEVAVFDGDGDGVGRQIQSASSLKRVSGKLIQEVVDNVLALNISDHEPDSELVDTIEGVTVAVDNIDITEQPVKAVSAKSKSDNQIISASAVRVDLNITQLQLIKLSPFLFQLAPQHCRIHTNEDVLIAMGGFTKLPPSVCALLQQGNETLKEIALTTITPSASSSSSDTKDLIEFHLPTDILTKSQLQVNSLISVSLKLDPQSDVIWPAECTPQMMLYTQMTITGGGGKVKPGTAVQYNISNFRLVDGLESLSCVVRLRETIPTPPATDMNKGEDNLYVDIETGATITWSTKDMGKNKPTVLLTFLNFTAPSLESLAAAGMSVDKKFPKGDKRKAGVYYVGCSVDEGKTFDFSEKPLLEIK